MTSSCRYFAKGGCSRGLSCRYSHGSANPGAPSNRLRVDAGSFVPVMYTMLEPTLSSAPPQMNTTSPVCRYYIQGHCRSGESCTFRHPPQAPPVSQPGCLEPPEEQGLLATGIAAMHIGTTAQDDHIEDNLEDDKQNNKSKELRDIAGVLVVFVDGAQVADVDVGKKSNGPSDRLQLSTVTCSWYKPSTVAWLQYSSSKWASYAADRFGQGRKVNGRTVSSKTTDPPSHYVRKPIWSVELGNLGVETTREDLEQFLKGIKPDKIVFGKPSYLLSEEVAGDLVQSKLAKYGSLSSFETSHSNNSARMKALARFTNASDANTAASALSRSRIPGFNGSQLFVSLTASAKIPVLKEHFEVINQELLEVQAVHPAVKFVFHQPERVGKPVIVRLIGNDVQALAKAKIAFEQLLRGITIYDDEGRPCWHSVFASATGLPYLRGLNIPGQAFVYRDLRRQLLTFHGNLSLLETTKQAVLAKAAESSALTHYIVLDPDLHRAAYDGGFRRIVDSLGKRKAKLDATKKPQLITITGTSGDVERARFLLFHTDDHDESHKHQTNDCPVCMSEPEEPTKLICSHIYCRECLHGLCSTVDSVTLPLKCCGDEGKCGQRLKITDLKNTLSNTDYESLLERSFAIHVQMHPNELRFCPTPDCPSVYQVTSDGTITTCHQCLSLICTSCHIISHDGLTCDQNRTMSRDDQALQKWKKTTGAQDCPNCQVLIEKSAGCNHMTCHACKTHFCWVCLKICSDKDIYRHMSIEHGNYGA